MDRQNISATRTPSSPAIELTAPHGALYVHIPYCESKCAYCDFNSYAGRDVEFSTYVDALCRDLERSVALAVEHGWMTLPLRTVFVGGGTPSVLPPALLTRVFDAIQGCGLEADAEVSVEANPHSLDEAFLEVALRGGLTRLSLGIQSLDDATLARLGRRHDRAGALEAVRRARRMGIDSLSLDFLSGLPGQGVAAWRDTLKQALALQPDHLSLYGLTLEKETPFGREHARGRLDVPDDDVQAEMFEAAREQVRAAGLQPYEISNFAREGHACRHNLNYWDNGAYLGVGAGAASYLGGWRWTRTQAPEVYTERIRADLDVVAEAERLSEAGRLSETLILGLRTTAGVDLAHCVTRHPVPGLTTERLAAAVEGVAGDLAAAGLMAITASHVCLTEAGVPLANGVMERMLDVPAYLTKPPCR